MKRWIGDCARTLKSISSARISRKRILAHGIDVVGRHQARHQIHRDIHRRRIERPAPEQHVERPALERAETGGVRDAPPESPKRLTRAGRPAQLMAVDQHRGVHRAGGGAGNAVDRQPRLLQQPVEHAPGEGAVRPASLQGEIDQNGLARYRLGFSRHLVNLERRATGASSPSLRTRPKAAPNGLNRSASGAGIKRPD